MKTSMKAALAGLIFVGGTAAAAAQQVVIAPEQETVIREYVKREPVASINLPGIELNLGSTVPDDVELYEVREKNVPYRYVVVGDRTMLMEPDTRRVVRVLD